MNSMKTLEQSMIDELQKTGYPTEIVSASIMQQRKWAVIHNPSYLDDNEDRSREFDIRAYHEKSFGHSEATFAIGTYLVTECKKSEKPWVFFTTAEQHQSSRLGRFIKARIQGRQVFNDRSTANT